MRVSTRKHLIWKFLLLLILVFTFCILSIRYFDQPIAYFISRMSIEKYKSSAPIYSLGILLTNLSYLCIVLTMGIYVMLRFLRVKSLWVNFMGILSLSVTITFFIKNLLELLFGRIAPCYQHYHASTINPALKNFWYGFNFSFLNAAGSFPSGHMIIFTCLLLLFRLRYPKTKLICYLLLIILAALLLFNNYHFLSDLMMGAYLGATIARVISRMMADDGVYNAHK